MKQKSIQKIILILNLNLFSNSTKCLGNVQIYNVIYYTIYAHVTWITIHYKKKVVVLRKVASILTNQYRCDKKNQCQFLF